ncbi:MULTISPECIES: hypothetical protein [unclassified Pseudomonas]|uniref:hypothetical protein n=1 Tax=unclassified Pseudomonas TaxID=196821 RepID=UPI002AC90AE1|nr:MULTISPECIES: hypothetical protein [unclassified Pseudomonas]MEB0044497.1 hypothetical protein [Pseudomonas sp. Dout3]MEB0095695.1 hypothetical protein [Pseudomonas sp. DC1.2]WPX58254.1 hypothetical protein RHM68_22100 [Pseudomonas sp. DC1.2]
MDDKHVAFYAYLFLDGFPLVLYQQRMQQQLKEPRLTHRQRLEAEVIVGADSPAARCITIAAHDDSEALLFKFVPDEFGYSIHAVVSGRYNEWRFARAGDSDQLMIVDKPIRGLRFKLVTSTTNNASLADLEPGPVYVTLIGEDAKSALFKDVQGETVAFVYSEVNLRSRAGGIRAPTTFVLKRVDGAVALFKGLISAVLP